MPVFIVNMAKPLVFKVGNKLKVVLFRNAVLMKPVRKESVLCSPDLLLQRSVLVSQKVLFQILKPTNGKIGDQTIRKDNVERDRKIAEKARKESEMERADTERRNLTLLDENNKKIEIYKAYAERIYKELQDVYATSEAEIRDRLQTTINDIFKQIYEGGLYLTIDEKYHISVYATDYDGDVETSTAQSISVIFAFITGIIKMARDNRNATDEDAQLLSSEPYPLVMDAPLSAFDKRRIKTVCEALPEAAEQVIIFIKDTDGELAEDYMGNRIGSRHHFDKKNEFETVLV